MGAGASLWTELRTTEAEASDQIPPTPPHQAPLSHNSQFLSSSPSSRHVTEFPLNQTTLDKTRNNHIFLSSNYHNNKK